MSFSANKLRSSMGLPSSPFPILPRSHERTTGDLAGLPQRHVRTRFSGLRAINVRTLPPEEGSKFLQDANSTDGGRPRSYEQTKLVCHDHVASRTSQIRTLLHNLRRILVSVWTERILEALGFN